MCSTLETFWRELRDFSFKHANCFQFELTSLPNRETSRDNRPRIKFNSLAISSTEIMKTIRLGLSKVKGLVLLNVVNPLEPSLFQEIFLVRWVFVSRSLDVVLSSLWT